MSEVLEDDFTPDTDTPATVEQLAEGMRQIESLPQLLAEVDRLKVEVAAMRERDALGRLEAWQKSGVDRKASAEVEDGVWCVELLDYSDGHKRAIVYGAPVTGSAKCVSGIGTDDKPATLAECILAAIDLWRQRYGEG